MQSRFLKRAANMEYVLGNCSRTPDNRFCPGGPGGSEVVGNTRNELLLLGIGGSFLVLLATSVSRTKLEDWRSSAGRDKCMKRIMKDDVFGIDNSLSSLRAVVRISEGRRSSLAESRKGGLFKVWNYRGFDTVFLLKRPL